MYPLIGYETLLQNWTKESHSTNIVELCPIIVKLQAMQWVGRCLCLFCEKKLTIGMIGAREWSIIAAVLAESLLFGRKCYKEVRHRGIRRVTNFLSE